MNIYCNRFWISVCPGENPESNYIGCIRWCLNPLPPNFMNKYNKDFMNHTEKKQTISCRTFQVKDVTFWAESVREIILKNGLKPSSVKTKIHCNISCRFTCAGLFPCQISCLIIFWCLQSLTPNQVVHWTHERKVLSPWKCQRAHNIS